MNTLSWFLYFAEVSETIGKTFGLMSFLLFIVFGFLTFFAVAYNILEGGPRYKTEGYGSDKKTIDKGPYRTRSFIALWTLWFIILMVAILAPSKDTLYMIAGSEIGEAVATTPEAKEILDETRKAILSQIKSFNKDK